MIELEYILIILGCVLLTVNLYYSLDYYLKEWTWSELRQVFMSFYCTAALYGGVYNVIMGKSLL